MVSCNAGSDEVPTDVSSSPSRNHNRNTSLEPTSTPTKELRDEADQQILQWASKLELESIELRERSSALMHNLSQRYDSLSHAAARFGEIEKSTYSCAERKYFNQLVQVFTNNVIRTEAEHDCYAAGVQGEYCERGWGGGARSSTCSRRALVGRFCAHVADGGYQVSVG